MARVRQLRHRPLEGPDFLSQDELLSLDDALQGREHFLPDGLVLRDEIKQRDVHGRPE
jgi:hypothetical protein